MERNAAPELNPAALPSGTQVGAWQVQAWRGRGTYGAVYLVRRAGRDEAEPTALKLALHAGDERFGREAELLSRIHHPSVPRLFDQGRWQSAWSHAYPYLVMEWVEGVPLYEWARTRNPTSRQVLVLLAHVARALEATHAVPGVHRDVKGENVLVRVADGRALLTDFGAGHYAGAASLTSELLPPGTPRYRSPEAWDFALRHLRHPTARYVAQPADDVFALGVTAYRLVTDEYPAPTDPAEEEARCWREEGGGPRHPLALNPRVAPQLGALILRMLAVRPQARGTAGELAEALEQVAEHAGPEVDEPLFVIERQDRSAWPTDEAAAADRLGHRPRHRDNEAVRVSLQRDAALRAEALARSLAPTERVTPRREASPWRSRLAAVVAGGLLLALGAWWAAQGHAEDVPAMAQVPSEGEARDGGSSSLGDTALAAPGVSSRGPLPSGGGGISVDLPQKPLPGQVRPDANGQCPSRMQIPINGGCWVELKAAPDRCKDGGYVYKGACYWPAFLPGREPTSSPTDR